MPSAALKACSYPGCVTLVRSGRCAGHRQAEVVYRDRETQRLYDRRWKVRRSIQLQAQPWCEECLRANVYTEATDVHHVERHEGDVEVFLSSPLESLCHSCHTVKTMAERVM